MSAPATTIITAAKSKKKPYTKPKIDKCYKCREPKHRSNEYPKRKQVNVVDYEHEDEGVVIEDTSDSAFAEEHGDPIAYVV